MTVGTQLANEIVFSIKDISGMDTIFTKNAYIYSATDSSRIGNYHKASLETERTGKPVIIRNDSSYTGCLPGVVFPFRFQDELIGVLGLTGDPDTAVRYKETAEKIAALLIREQLIQVASRNQRSQMNIVMQTLINGSGLNHEFMTSFLAPYHLKNYKNYRILIVQIDNRMNPANLRMIEEEVCVVFDQTGSDLYTFRYPNEYVLLLEDAAFQKSRSLLISMANDNSGILCVGVGDALKMDHVPDSYRSAQIALQSLRRTSRSFAVFDELGIDLILSDVSDVVKKRYIARTIKKLSEKEKKILTEYFNHGMALGKTADVLFIHRNTLQYQLDKIYEITGFNPRDFRDATALYLALLLYDQTILDSKQKGV